MGQFPILEIEEKLMQISQSEIELLKKYISGRVAYARYYAQGVWTKTPINKISMLSDGRVAIYILFDGSAPDHIDKIQFYNHDDEIFAAGDETIDKETSGGDILYRYTVAFAQTIK